MNRRTDTTHACPVVSRRELQRNQQMHRDRLQKMKSALDTRAPAPQPHLTLYGRDYVAKKRATTEAAFADLKMIQSIARTMTRDHKIEERKGPISLNADGRKQEIYRIMRDNHKLLDSIENCEPMMRTTDMVKADKNRKRYIINSSHTMRLSGEYDDEITRIKNEDKSKLDESRRVAHLRYEKHQRMMKSTGSVSLPSLSPNGTRGGETPPRKPASPPKAAQASGRGRGGESSSSSSGYKASPPGGRGRGRGAGPPEAPPGPPEKPQKLAAEEEEAEEMKAVPEPKASIRFELEETQQEPEELNESYSSQRRPSRTKTPHAGSIDLSKLPDEEDEEDADEQEQEVSGALASFTIGLAEGQADEQEKEVSGALASFTTGLAEGQVEEKQEQEVSGALADFTVGFAEGQPSDEAAKAEDDGENQQEASAALASFTVGFAKGQSSDPADEASAQEGKGQEAPASFTAGVASNAEEQPSEQQATEEEKKEEEVAGALASFTSGFDSSQGDNEQAAKEEESEDYEETFEEMEEQTFESESAQ